VAAWVQAPTRRLDPKALRRKVAAAEEPAVTLIPRGRERKQAVDERPAPLAGAQGLRSYVSLLLWRERHPLAYARG